MATRNINVLLSSFGGLGLPSTFNLICQETLSFEILMKEIRAILPPLNCRIIVTTASNKVISPCSSQVSSLLHDGDGDFIQLRLSVPLRGGKGGFGSQLRAAGGRMSSKRKKNQGENSGSNRNLDGRRLRTVNEAKALAEYLALKPDMEKKEKEARRKRWEEVVALAERKEEEIRSGAKGKVDGQWAEDKEEISERTREAVHATMKLGDYHDDLQGMAGRREMVSAQKDQKESMATAALAGPESTSKEGVATRSYMGFEEDNEFMSDSSSE